MKPVGPATDQALVALVGPPNSGKTTLFNQLTKTQQATLNAPHTTVELVVGPWGGFLDDAVSPNCVQIADLPGTYSLVPSSPDEAVTATVVTACANQRSRPGAARISPLKAKNEQLSLVGDKVPNLVVALIDASAPAASLYLVGQLLALCIPTVAALTRLDLAQRQGVKLNLESLARALGMPIVPVNPRLGQGIAELTEAVRRALVKATDDRLETKPKGQPCEVACPWLGSASGATRERLKLNAGVQPGEIACQRPRPASGATLEQQSESIFDWVAQVTQCSGLDGPPVVTRSDRIDRWLLRASTGIPVFLVVLWGVLQLTSLVAPFQEWLRGWITGPASHGLATALEALGWGGGWFESLMVDGLMAGVGTVVSFLPLLAIMFCAIGLLEDSGYMARVAVLADRLMRTLGLDGRAVLPLVIGFGCNVPALTAARALPNYRQRLLTSLLIPFTSCSARLVVFLFLAQIFFPANAGTVVFGLYVVSVFLVVLVGLVLRHTRFGDLVREPLIMVLPAYQVPRLWPLLRSIWSRCLAFAWQAGRLIVLFSLIVWLGMSIPATSGSRFGPGLAATDSALGAGARLVAPVFQPAGFNDWRAMAALAAGAAAKEATVATLVTTLGMDQSQVATDSEPISVQVRQVFDQSSGGHGGAAALAFMVFSLVYMPCVATLAAQRRLLGGKPTLAMAAMSLLLAWVLAVGVFQIGRLI